MCQYFIGRIWINCFICLAEFKFCPCVSKKCLLYFAYLLTGGVINMKKLVCILLSLLTAMTPVCALGEELPAYSAYEPLCGLAANYGFKLGGCLSYGQLNDPAYLDFLATHFNSVTMTNETKAYSLLSPASSASRDGTPIMNFAQADKMVAWAQENGLKVRGHVLVWDAYMTDWFSARSISPTCPTRTRRPCVSA